MNKNHSVLKKTFSALLALLILAVSIPISICAETLASGECGDELTWTLDESGTLTVSGTGKMWDWSYEEIPFYEYQYSFVSVVIENGVTSIGEWAFQYCYNLTSITIPDGVTSIGRGAFNGCSNLTSITIPDGVTSIGESAFYECSNLTSITIPESVTSIGTDAFYNCYKLVEVINHSSLDLGSESDYGGITNHAIEIHDGSSKIVNNDGYLFYTFDETYLVNYVGNDTDLTLPDIGKDYIINHYAFSWCSNLTSVTIPSSVTSIGEYAFYYCSSLTSITIPEGVTSIGDCAFYECTSLTSVTIPDSVTSIGDRAFSYCSSLTIYGIYGSYAQTYAEDNDIPFREVGTAVYGDANGDGSVTLADVTLLMKHLAGWDVTIYADTDVSVTLADVTLLLKYLAGWDVTLG